MHARRRVQKQGRFSFPKGHYSRPSIVDLKWTLRSNEAFEIFFKLAFQAAVYSFLCRGFPFKIKVAGAAEEDAVARVSEIIVPAVVVKGSARRRPLQRFCDDNHASTGHKVCFW